MTYSINCEQKQKAVDLNDYYNYAETAAKPIRCGSNAHVIYYIFVFHKGEFLSLSLSLLIIAWELFESVLQC